MSRKRGHRVKGIKGLRFKAVSDKQLQKSLRRMLGTPTGTNRIYAGAVGTGAALGFGATFATLNARKRRRARK